MAYANVTRNSLVHIKIIVLGIISTWRKTLPTSFSLLGDNVEERFLGS